MIARLNHSLFPLIIMSPLNDFCNFQTCSYVVILFKKKKLKWCNLSRSRWLAMCFLMIILLFLLYATFIRNPIDKLESDSENAHV